MHLLDGDGAFTDRRSDAFDRATPDISHGEDPRHAGLEQEGVPFQAPDIIPRLRPVAGNGHPPPQGVIAPAVRSGPVTMNPHLSRTTASPSHSVRG